MNAFWFRSVWAWLLWVVGSPRQYWKSIEWNRPRLVLTVCKFRHDAMEDSGAGWVECGRLSLNCFGQWFKLWITLTPPREMLTSWGVAYDRDQQQFRIERGDHCQTWRIPMPWAWQYVGTWVMLEDGHQTFVRYERYPQTACTRSQQRDGQFPIEWPVPLPDGYYHREGVSYTYRLRRGGEQVVSATITQVERRVWRWKLTHWLGLPLTLSPRKTRANIAVEFSEELGSERGSWKGGVIGTGFDLLPGEDPIICLRRMEAAQHGKYCRR